VTAALHKRTSLRDVVFQKVELLTSQRNFTFRIVLEVGLFFACRWYLILVVEPANGEAIHFMAQIFHPSSNAFSKFSIFGGLLIVAAFFYRLLRAIAARRLQD